MILLFLDIVKNEGINSDTNYLWEFFLAVVSACVLLFGIKYEKHLERKKEERHKITGVKVLNKLVNKTITNLNENIVEIEAAVSQIELEPSKIIKLKSYSYLELDLIKKISAQDLYMGYLTVFKTDESLAVSNYSNILNSLSILEIYLQETKLKIDESFLLVVESNVKMSVDFQSLIKKLRSKLNKPQTEENDEILYLGYLKIIEQYNFQFSISKIPLPNIKMKIQFFITPFKELLEEHQLSQYYEEFYKLICDFEFLYEDFENINNSYRRNLNSRSKFLNEKFNELIQHNGVLSAELFKQKDSSLINYFKWNK